eukprot:gb/GECG01015827.1/.p1 GENE.gb/GECG01015827.1/~~gb/GECG01015827.1/.p1  ORF type:complete len:2154 (+),score=273.56 gb/GECG01015827.1/:1-6462(+)
MSSSSHSSAFVPLGQDQLKAFQWTRERQREEESYAPFPRRLKEALTSSSKHKDLDDDTNKTMVYCIQVQSSHVRLPKRMRLSQGASKRKSEGSSTSTVEPRIQYRFTFFDSKTRSFFGNTYKTPLMNLEQAEGFKDLRTCTRPRPIYFHSGSTQLDKNCGLVIELVLVHTIKDGEDNTKRKRNKEQYGDASTDNDIDDAHHQLTVSRLYPAVSLGWTVVSVTDLISHCHELTSMNDDGEAIAGTKQNKQGKEMQLQQLRGSPRALLHSTKQPSLSVYTGDHRSLLSVKHWNSAPKDCTLTLVAWRLPNLFPLSLCIATQQIVGPETRIPGLEKLENGKEIIGVNSDPSRPRTECQLQKRLILKFSRPTVRLCKGYESSLLDFLGRWADQQTGKPLKEKSSVEASIGRRDLFICIHNTCKVQESTVLPLDVANSKRSDSELLQAQQEFYLESYRINPCVSICIYLIVRVDFSEVVATATHDAHEILKQDETSALSQYLRKVDDTEFDGSTSKYMCLASSVFFPSDGEHVRLSNRDDGQWKYVPDASLEIPLCVPENDARLPAKVFLPGTSLCDSCILQGPLLRKSFGRGNIVFGCELDPDSVARSSAIGGTVSNTRGTKAEGLDKRQRVPGGDKVSSSETMQRRRTGAQTTPQGRADKKEFETVSPPKQDADETEEEAVETHSMKSYDSTGEGAAEDADYSSEGSLEFSESYEDVYASGDKSKSSRGLSTELLSRTFQLPVVSEEGFAESETPSEKRLLTLSSEESTHPGALEDKAETTSHEGRSIGVSKGQAISSRAGLGLPYEGHEQFRPLGGFVSRAARTRIGRYGFNDVLDAMHDIPAARLTGGPQKDRGSLWERRSKDRKDQDQLSRLHELQSRMWTTPSSGLAISSDHVPVLDASLELSDPRQRMELCFEFCSVVPSPSSRLKNTPPSVLSFSFSFYTLQGVKSSTLHCLRDTENMDEVAYVLKIGHGSSEKPQATSVEVSQSQQLRFTVEVDMGHHSESSKRSFIRYLMFHAMQVEVWDAESLMPVGNAFVPLYNFLRQQKKQVVVAREFDIVRTNSLAGQDYASPGEAVARYGLYNTSDKLFASPMNVTVEGRLQMILASVGKHTKNKKQQSANGEMVQPGGFLMSSSGEMVSRDLGDLRRKRVVSNARPVNTERDNVLDMVHARGAGKTSPKRGSSKVLVRANKREGSGSLARAQQKNVGLNGKYAAREDVISYEEIQSLRSVFGENTLSIDHFVYFVTGVDTLKNEKKTLEETSKRLPSTSDDDSLEGRIYDAFCAHLDRLRTKEKLDANDPSVAIGDDAGDRGSLVFQAFEDAEEYVRKKQRVAQEYKDEKPYHRRKQKDTSSSDSDESDYLSDENNPEIDFKKEHSLLTSGETHVPLEKGELTLGRLRYVFTKSLKLKLTEDEWKLLIERYAKKKSRRKAKGAAKNKSELLVVDYKSVLNDILDSAASRQKERRLRNAFARQYPADITNSTGEYPSLMITRGKFLRSLSEHGRGHAVSAAYFLRAVMRTVDWKGSSEIEWRHLAMVCQEYLNLHFELEEGKVGISRSSIEQPLFDKNATQDKPSEGYRRTNFDADVAENQWMNSQNSITVPNEVLDFYREAHKRDSIRRMLHSQLTTEYPISCRLGEISFFEHTVINPLPHDDRVQITIDDPFGELRLVSNPSQWQYLLDHLSPQSPDKGLEYLKHNYPSAVGSQRSLRQPFTPEGELMLRPGEAITLPFIFISFADGVVTAGGAPITASEPRVTLKTTQGVECESLKELRHSSPPSSSTSQVIKESATSARQGSEALVPYGNEETLTSREEQVLSMESRTIRRRELAPREVVVTVSSATHSRAFARISVSTKPELSTSHKTLRYFCPEGEYLTANIAVPEGSPGLSALKGSDLTSRVSQISNRVSDRNVDANTQPLATDTGIREKYMHCADSNVVLRAKEVGYTRQMQFQYRVGTFPSIEEFYIFVYRDPHCCELLERWRVIVHPLKKYSIQTFSGQATFAEVGVPGDVKSRAVRLYSSSPDEFYCLGNRDVALVPNKYSKVKLRYEPVQPGTRRFLLNVIDIDTQELISAWHVTAEASMPPITKRYHVILPSARESLKRIPYFNPWKDMRRFLLKCSNPAAVHLRETEISLAVSAPNCDSSSSHLVQCPG